jgi:hypothetical protein
MNTKPVEYEKIGYVLPVRPASYITMGTTYTEEIASLPNNYGLKYSSGINPYIEFRMTNNKYYDICMHIDNTNQLYLKWGYLKYTVGNIDIQIGRLAHWWGPGYNGTWLLTNNTKCFDQVKISNYLPWVLKYIGQTWVNMVIGRLSKQKVMYYDKDRLTQKVKKPWFVGIRVNCMPNRYIEIGISATCMFNARNKLNPIECIRTIFPDNDATDREVTAGMITNRLASMDITLNIPVSSKIFNGLQVYWEYGGEDWNTTDIGFKTLSATANLFGLYLAMEHTDIIIEYAENIDDKVKWYTHSQFTGGYTHKNKILGHHINGRVWYMNILQYLSADMIATMKYERCIDKTYEEWIGITICQLNSWLIEFHKFNKMPVVKIGYIINLR